jgi:hypothetical protein
MDFDRLDEKTAFKLGFATRCFEMGLEPDQVKEAMEKSAIWRHILPYLSRLRPYAGAAATGAGGLLSGLGIGGAFNAAKDISGLGLGLAGGAGLLGGAALGYGKAKLDEDDISEDDIKAKELADTYKVYADRLKAQKAYRQYRQSREAR